MKIRIFEEMDDAVFRIVIETEDWSEGDIELMVQYGEPEINVGGDVEYVFDGDHNTKQFGDQFVRILHGFPYSIGFDSRDYKSIEESISVGQSWKDMIVGRIRSAILSLRENRSPIQSEEVIDI